MLKVEGTFFLQATPYGPGKWVNCSYECPICEHCETGTVGYIDEPGVYDDFKTSCDYCGTDFIVEGESPMTILAKRFK